MHTAQHSVALLADKVAQRINERMAPRLPAIGGRQGRRASERASRGWDEPGQPVWQADRIRVVVLLSTEFGNTCVVCDLRGAEGWTRRAISSRPPLEKKRTREGKRKRTSLREEPKVVPAQSPDARATASRKEGRGADAVGETDMRGQENHRR